ncbi:glutenin, high molecular weight subunit DX5-like [Amphibalanus amphitrite]|uniref:glutenin, high molecular weight subunit DX5-like n=1 Tax=Amphibalanus amphitrite TaxID=1232801 RepID=UPI001C915917|nr:glutenin, high molecular weight subunit DX5-like [Amphibalanus amphitrite]
MRCTALSLVALVASAAAYQIPPPSGLYETPTTDFGSAPTQLNEVSQAPIGSNVGDDGFSQVSDSTTSFSQQSNGAGCCGNVVPSGPLPVASGPVHGGVQPVLPGGSHSSSVISQSTQSAPSPSGLPSQSVSTQTVSGPSSSGVVSLSSDEQSQSSYYESTSSVSQPATGIQRPAVAQSVNGPLLQRPSNMFLDNPGQFQSNSFSQSSQTVGQTTVGQAPVGQAPINSDYSSNVFLNGGQDGAGASHFSSSSSEYYQQGSSDSSSQTSFQQSTGSGSGPSGQLTGFGSNPTGQQSTFVSSQTQKQPGFGPSGSQSTFVSSQTGRQPGLAPSAQQSTFISSQTGRQPGLASSGQQSTFISQQTPQQQPGLAPSGQQSTFISSQTGRQPGLGQQSTVVSQQAPQQPGLAPSGQQSTFVSQQTPQQPGFGQQSTVVSQQTPQQPGFAPSGQQSTFVSQQTPQQPSFGPAQSGLPTTVSQTGSNLGQPSVPLASGQLLNRHPGGGGSGPLGHQTRTCSTSLVCVPIAMCNPYTGFVRGGLLFEPEEPTLQPTVALDRCTELKDGGTGDGVCCQMPHINDPWPRDQ